MKLKLLLLFTVALLGFGFMRPESVVHAQPEPICTPSFCGESLPLHNWVNTGYCTPTRNLDGTWESCVHQVAGNRWAQLRVSYTFESMQDVTNLTFNYSGNVWVAAIGFDYCAVQQSGCHSSNVRHIWYNSNDDPDLSTRGLSQERVFRITILLESEPCGVYVCSAESLQRILKLSNVRFCSSSDMFCEEEPEYYKPFKAGNLVATEPYIFQEHTIVSQGVRFVSDRPRVPVHAPADGVVVSVSPLLRDKINLDGTRCTESVCIDASNAYTVGIETSDNAFFVYTVLDAHKYIRLGEEITASCVMGEALEANTLNGFTLVTGGHDLELEPFGDTPCVDIVNPEDRCLTGSAISDFNIRGGNLEDDRVILEANGLMRQPMALPSKYLTRAVVVASKLTDQDASFSVQIGDSSYEFNSLTTLPTEFSTPYNQHSPNVAGFHEIKVSNQSSEQLVIHSVCLQILIPENSLTRPDECYFQNWDFAGGAGGWAMSENITIDDEVGALISVSSSGTTTAWLSQPAKLMVESNEWEHTYILDVVFSLWYTPDFIPMPMHGISGHFGIELEVDYANSTSTSLVVSALLLHSARGEAKGSIEIILEDNSDEDFVIVIEINNNSEHILGYAIQSLCLRPDGNDWPGYGISDLESDRTINESCKRNPQPASFDIGRLDRWVTWIWRGIRGLFECKLPSLLNDILAMVRWVILIIIEFMRWIAEVVIPWLGGHFANLGNGMIENVWNIFLSIIDAVKEFLIRAFNLLRKIIELLISQITVWNETPPIAISFLPNCNIQPEKQALCTIFWGLEVTILSGPVGSLIVPLFMASVGLTSLIYYVRRFIKLFERSSTNA
jgi:hypothetical protein